MEEAKIENFDAFVSALEPNNSPLLVIINENIVQKISLCLKTCRHEEDGEKIFVEFDEGGLGNVLKQHLARAISIIINHEAFTKENGFFEFRSFGYGMELSWWTEPAEIDKFYNFHLTKDGKRKRLSMSPFKVNFVLHAPEETINVQEIWRSTATEFEFSQVESQKHDLHETHPEFESSEKEDLPPPRLTQEASPPRSSFNNTLRSILRESPESPITPEDVLQSLPTIEHGESESAKEAEIVSTRHVVSHVVNDRIIASKIETHTIKTPPIRQEKRIETSRIEVHTEATFEQEPLPIEDTSETEDEGWIWKLASHWFSN
jgi:hypothetical protein